MRAAFAAFTLVCAGLLVTVNANVAQDTKKDPVKDTVLKGTITCNKCDLGNTTKCETVIVVKAGKDKKDIIYIFDKASHGKFHGDTCNAPKAGTVTGTVMVVDKKNVVTVKKLDYDK